MVAAKGNSRAVGHGVGVNLDPANFLLHGTGDPLHAVRTLAPHALQVHLKDADPPATPGAWGRERAFGDGSVDWAACLTVLRAEAVARGAPLDLMIEREFGDQRLDDVRGALRRVSALLADATPAR